MKFPAWSQEAARSILLPLQNEPGPVLMALQAISKHFGYVHPDAVAIVASEFNVSRADVHGVLTFYHDFRTTPAPKNCIKICVAEACQAVGSRELVIAAQKEFGIVIDQMSLDTEIQSAYCFGNCALGPATMVNGALIGKTDIAKLVQAIK